MHRPMAPAIASVVALVACGGNSPPEQTAVEVCDGSDGLRLAAQLVVPSDRFDQGEVVVYDNGAAFLFVTGTCEYAVRWSSGGDNIFRDTRFGTLTDDAVDELGTALDLDHFDAHAGQFAGEAQDAGTLRIAFAGATIECTGGCTGATLPTWLTEMRDALDGAAGAIDAAGEPRELPQRVVVVVHDGGASEPLYEWPAALDPAAIAIPAVDAASLPFGSGTLVDGADGDDLRVLRRAVAQTATPAAAFVWHTREGQPPEYRVFLRDAVPWEDERGIVTVP